MEEAIHELMLTRVEKTHTQLIKDNNEYSKAIKENRELARTMQLLKRLEADELTICRDDCEDLEKYLNNIFIISAIIEQETYKQGFRDCLWLMKYLKINF